MIYFLRSEQDVPERRGTFFIQAGWIKIGTTVRLSERLKQIAAKIGHTPTVLGVLDGGYAEEAAIHERYKGVHRCGEWFDPEHSNLLKLIADEATPWDGSDEIPGYRPIKFDSTLARKARFVADAQGVSLAVYLSGLLRSPVDDDFAQAVKKLTKGSKE